MVALRASETPSEETTLPETLLARAPAAAIPIEPVAVADWARWLKKQSAADRRWIERSRFRAEGGLFILLPGDGGEIARVILATGPETIWDWAGLPGALPEGAYRIATRLGGKAASDAALGWMLGTYAFTRYKRRAAAAARLAWPDGANHAAAARMADAITLVRDLITTPAADMGPADIAAAARRIARRHRARCTVITGDALLRRRFAGIHAVGRGSARPPGLIDIAWGAPRAPKVTLVGKGVCFDSGGYDLKPPGGMKLMKKDMGGAAHVLALAGLIMGAKLPVRLRVLVPAVENMVSGHAYRPLDVITMRSGQTVEVGDTDAEGRLILADALYEAAQEKPDLLVDFATLTGAARAALGAELPALFCNDDALAAEILETGAAENDPLWRLPLWQPYRRLIESKVADLSSTGSAPYGGAITAALFLESFVMPKVPWAHIDLMAWNTTSRPGRPEGGEAMALRAIYALIARRYPREAGPGARADLQADDPPV